MVNGSLAANDRLADKVPLLANRPVKPLERCLNKLLKRKFH